MWLKDFVSEMLWCSCVVKIHCDNQSALALAKNPTFHNGTKHIDHVGFHYVCDAVQENKVSLMKASTTHNLAGLLTKVLNLIILNTLSFVKAGSWLIFLLSFSNLNQFELFW